MKKSTKKKPVPKTRNIYTLDIKANALRLYLIGLTLNEISKVINASVRTVEKWQITENWKQQRQTTAVHQKAFDLYTTGKTYKEIAIILNKSQPTIGRYIKKARNENNID